MGNRRFGWHSGNVKALNIQGGTVDITTDGNGDGTGSVTFDNAMKDTPVVILTQQEADITGTLNATSVTNSGFTAKVDGSSVLSGTLTVGWIALDY